MRRSASSRGRRTRRCAGGCSTSDRSRAALTSRTGSADRTILALRPRDLAVLGLIENRAAVLVAAVVGLLWETGMLERAVSRVGIDVAGPGVLRRLLVSIFRDGTLPVRRHPQGGRRDRGAADRAPDLLRHLGHRAVVRVPADARRRRSADRVRAAHARVGDGAAAPHSDVDGPTRAHCTAGSIGPRSGSKRREARRRATAAGQSSRGRESLAPIIDEPELPALLRIVLPDLSLGEPVWHGPAPGAFGRELRARLVLALIGALLSAFVLGWWAVAVLALLHRVGLDRARASTPRTSAGR